MVNGCPDNDVVFGSGYSSLASRSVSGTTPIVRFMRSSLAIECIVVDDEDVFATNAVNPLHCG